VGAEYVVQIVESQLGQAGNFSAALLNAVEALCAASPDGAK
jgi:hypothetical protein